VPGANVLLLPGFLFSMISYFTGGINNCTPDKKISIERLVKEIRTNKAPVIDTIRALDPTAKDYQKQKRQLKTKLSYVTPNCTVSYRSDENIIEFSGYLYFDIDGCHDAADEKLKLIEKYADYLSLVCISASGRGLSFLVKVENEITTRNFHSIRSYLCEHIFQGLKLDHNPSAMSNSCYVSHDPECHFNPAAIIEIPEEYTIEIIKKTKSANSTINNSSPDIVPNAPYKHTFVSIRDVLNVLKFSTEVQIKNRVFDIEPTDYCEVVLKSGYYIPDRKKRAAFSQIIHNLLYLNPAVERDYILSYIIWVNEHRTVTPANKRDVISWFDTVVKKIETAGELRPKLKVKYFHCRKKTIAPDVKQKLGIRLVNLYKSEEYIYQIGLAKQIIEIQKSANNTINNPSTDIVPNALCRATQSEVFQLIKERAKQFGAKGIGIRTIKKYWNAEPVGIDEIIEMENERLAITYISPDKEGNTPAHYM